MFGVNNNNTNYVSQVPSTFGTAYNNQPQTNNAQTGAVNPFQGGDKYSVDNTSQAFDQAMAKLTGQNVFTNQSTAPTTQQTASTQQNKLPAGVTESDMNWALSLEDKVKGGYTPTDQETQTYQNIASKLSAAMNNPTAQAQTNPQANSNIGVTQEELNWALAVETKVKGGYSPNAQETQAYQNIAAKMAASSNQQTGATPPTQQTSPTGQLPAGVSQDEINWALALESKAKSGYSPNAQETQAYQNIATKMAASSNQQTGATPPTQQTSPTGQLPAGVSQDEINWALALETKVKGGYSPNAQETQTYQNIAAKMAAGSTQQTGATPPTQQTAPTGQLPAGVSQDEINWALALETKVKGGYSPNAQETDTYQKLAQKLSSGNAQQPGANQAKPVSQDEINWALALENKAKSGYSPNPQETSTYQDIANRLQVQQQSGSTQNSSTGQTNKDWSAWSQPFTVPKSLFQTTPRIIQVPATLRSAVPTLPTYTAVNVGPDLNAGKTANVPRTLPKSGTTQPATTGNTGSVSKQEIDWALALEAKVKGGYNPNESELYQYKNIADRLQASQGKTQQGGGGQDTTTKPTQSGTSIGKRLSNAWGALTK